MNKRSIRQVMTYIDCLYINMFNLQQEAMSSIRVGRVRRKASSDLILIDKMKTR